MLHAIPIHIYRVYKKEKFCVVYAFVLLAFFQVIKPEGVNKILFGVDNIVFQ